jgi:hypothetical protein
MVDGGWPPGRQSVPCLVAARGCQGRATREEGSCAVQRSAVAGPSLSYLHLHRLPRFIHSILSLHSKHNRHAQQCPAVGSVLVCTHTQRFETARGEAPSLSSAVKKATP